MKRQGSHEDLPLEARAYGACLSLTFALSGAYWWRSADFLADGAPGRIPKPGLAWVPLPDLSAWGWQAWLAGTAALALVAALALLRGYVREGRLLLAAAFALKLTYFAMDDRLMGNYHYMPLLASFAWLLWPARFRLHQLLVTAFYLGAGILKLNPEWLSGAAIPPHWLGPRLYEALLLRRPWLLQAGAHWVVALELFFVLWLLGSSRALRAAALAQLALFHAISFAAVGWFYPCIMACLLAVFPLGWRRPEERRIGKGGVALLLAFALAQLAPFATGADPALAREHGSLALNMFDARPFCHDLILVRTPGRLLDLSVDPGRQPLRTMCEPALFVGRALELCGEKGAAVTLRLQSRRSTDNRYTRLITQADVCATRPAIHFWRSHDWLVR